MCFHFPIIRTVFVLHKSSIDPNKAGVDAPIRVNTVWQIKNKKKKTTIIYWIEILSVNYFLRKKSDEELKWNDDLIE